MERRNITLSLPKELIKQAKHLAVERDTSLSGLLSELLEQLVRNEMAYREAAKRFKRRLKKGFNLGTKGQITWKREDLYER